MTAEAPPSSAPSGPLTTDLAGRAIAAAAQMLGYDPATVFELARDGRGRVRLLAAAALIHPTERQIRAVAKVMAVHPNTLAPSCLTTRGITAAQIAEVQAAAFAPAAQDAEMLKSETLIGDGPAKRTESGWVDPRRSLDREGRILAARTAGHGPVQIATAEGLSVSTVKKIIARSGRTFPALRPGCAPSPKPEKTASSPRPAKARAVRPKPVKPVVEAAPVQVSVAEVRLEPFPDKHAAWAPLPGSVPVRLIHHDRGCRWPVTVEGVREPMVCNLPDVPGSQYCERHRWLGASPAIRATLRRPASAPDASPQSEAA